MKPNFVDIMMKKKILFGVCTAFLLAGCGGQPPTAVETPTNVAKEPRENLENLIFEQGFSSAEYFESVRSAVLNIQMNEAIKTAVEEKTPESCDRIPDEYLKKNCRDSALKQEAITGDDDAVCAKISSRESQIACADDVFSHRATTKGDDRICNKIQNEMIRANCASGAALTNARLNLDPNACRVIADEDAQKFCVEEVKRALDAKNL